MSSCRYCRLEISASDKAVTFSYWSAIKYDCHKSCKQDGERQEAFECQILDADCNDCRHFVRGSLVKKSSFNGHCVKFNKPTKAFPKQSTGHKCFEHRRGVLK